MIAETRSHKPSQVDVGNARSVAIAVLQAEVHHPSENQAPQILVDEMGGFLEHGEHVKYRPMAGSVIGGKSTNASIGRLPS